MNRSLWALLISAVLSASSGWAVKGPAVIIVEKTIHSGGNRLIPSLKERLGENVFFVQVYLEPRNGAPIGEARDFDFNLLWNDLTMKALSELTSEVLSVISCDESSVPVGDRIALLNDLLPMARTSRGYFVSHQQIRPIFQFQVIVDGVGFYAQPAYKEHLVSKCQTVLSQFNAMSSRVWAFSGPFVRRTKRAPSRF